MSKLTELLAELAEEGLDADDLEAVLEIVKRRKAAGGPPSASLARVEREPPVEFPAGPNAARAIERRGRQMLDVTDVNRRGLAMYGNESPDEAYDRWMAQERSDAEGVYGPGGGTAGGIFGDAPVTMADYDPAAHRRTESAQGGAAMARLGVVLERILERVEGLEGRQAAPQLRSPAPRRLRGK